MKSTVTISIGNSDNKLAQSDWRYYCRHINDILSLFDAAMTINFYGLTNSDSEYQSATWIIEILSHHMDELKEKLTKVRKSYNQVSIALVVGKTEFI